MESVKVCGRKRGMAFSCQRMTYLADFVGNFFQSGVCDGVRACKAVNIHKVLPFGTHATVIRRVSII